MVQTNQLPTIPEVPPMVPSPALGRVLAIGINPTPKPPKMMLRFGDLSITLQPDGQVALFTSAGLFACECKGSSVEALPPTAELKAVFLQDAQRVGLYQDEKTFYTKRSGGRLTALKNTDYTSPYAEEIDDDSPELCGLFHTDDASIPDSDYDDTPLPTRMPDDD